MPRELPRNQIRPAAQPVAFFLQPAGRQVAAPAGPLEIPRAPGIEVIQQGSGGNVQGYNAFEQVAQALAPFSQRLTELGAFGMEAYASAEVQRGINEAMRAKALLDEQQRQSGREYAAENRRLAQSDPIGALMMDSVNPFRQSGRQRALTQLAGAEVKGAQISAYRNAHGLQSLAPGDPRLAEVKAAAVQGVLQKYRVNEGSPGFAQFVLPQVNEGSDRVTEMHWQDRQGYLKSTIPRSAASEMFGFYVKTLEDKQVEYFTPDGQRVVIPSTDPRFDGARSARMGAILDRLVDEAGLPGEATDMKRQAFERLKAIADADGNEELKRLLLGLPVGPPDSKGFREPALTFFSVEALDSELKYGEVSYRRAQRAQEALAAQYQDQLVELTYGVPDGAERLQRIERLRASAEYQGLSLNQKLELEQKTSTNIDAVTARGRSAEGASALLLDMESRYGSAWNTAEADAEFQRALASAPEKDRPELRQRYAQVRRRNSEREASPTSKEVSGVIDRAIKANLLANYPRTVTEAALRGVSAEQVMAGWADANVAESARRQFSAFQSHVRNRIAAAEAQKGRPLTAAEATAEASQAIGEYGRSRPEEKRYLFPGIDGQPGAGSRQQPPAPAPTGGQQSRPGTRPFTGRVYPSGQLDNIPDRPGRVSSWRSQPVLDAASVVQEANRIIGGGAPSAALRRFARDAGTTPGEFLNRHLDYYRDSLEVPAADRQKLLRDGRQSQAVRNTAAAVATSGGLPGPIGRAGTMLMDLLMGTRPAAAAQRQPQLRSAVGLAGPAGAQQVATRSAAPAGPPITSPVLDRLASGRLYAPPRPGLCVTAVLESMQLNGIPNPAAAGGDSSNHPRGLASQLVRDFGWRPLPGVGRPRTLNSSYGSFTVNQLSLGEYQAAVEAGRVPSGAIVFQTMKDWDGGHPKSTGFDAAIARNGGRNLWNGRMAGSAVYGSATRQVFVLVPGDPKPRGGSVSRRR